MAQYDDLYTALRNADAAGDTAAAKRLASYIKTLPAAIAPAEAAPDPTGSFGQNMLAGAGQFMTSTATGVKQLVNDAAAGLENITPAPIARGINWANQKLGGQSPQLTQAQGRADIEETRKLDAPLNATAGGMAGNALAGLALAPLLPATGTLAGAGAIGAGMGLAQPATSWSERAGNVAGGAAAGAAGQGAVNALARLVKPNTSPQITALMREGVTPTPGQILGGGFKRAEEGLTSVPVVGDAIKAGQRRAMEDVNRAAFNRALAPIGDKLPAGTMGRDAVEYTGQKLGAAYDSLLPRMTTQADQTFGQEIQNLQSMVRSGAIDPNAATAFERILQNDMLGKFQGQNAVTGQTLKQIEGDLGQQIKRFGQSQDADQRMVGDALKEAQRALRDLLQRSNPQYADELKAINAGYANFKTVQRAAAGLGAEDGVFSPAQLQNAVKAADRSKDKGRFAKGDALMRDLSETAKTALGNKVPDSGTPYRTMTALGAGGGAAALLNPAAAAAVLTAPVMYSKAGQNALAALLAKRPQGANQLAALVRKAGPSAALVSSAVAEQK